MSMSILGGDFAVSMLLGFVGGLGGPELAVLLVVLLVIVGFLIAIVFIILAVVRASKKPGGPPPIARENTTQARLNELEALRTSGAITESEYEEKRGEILTDL